MSHTSTDTSTSTPQATTPTPIPPSKSTGRIAIDHLIDKMVTKADRLSEAADELIRVIYTQREDARYLHEAVETLDRIAAQAQRTPDDHKLYDRMLNRLLDRDLPPDAAWLGLSW